MRKHQMKRYLPICLLLLSLSANGEITKWVDADGKEHVSGMLRKWVDADGKVHYSDEPPPTNVKAKTLTTPSAASGVPAQKTYVEREAEWKKSQKAREDAAQKSAQQQEEALSKQKYCVDLRANLIAMEKSPSIATYNDKGERGIMDDATRQKKIEEVRKQISSNCN